MNLDQLVADYATLTAQIDALTARRDEVKAQLRDLGAGKHETTTGLVVTVTPQRRFNAAKAAETLPADVVAQCLDFSASKARAVLAPALYQAFMEDSGDPRVSVK